MYENAEESIFDDNVVNESWAMAFADILYKDATDMREGGGKGGCG